MFCKRAYPLVLGLLFCIGGAAWAQDLDQPAVDSTQAEIDSLAPAPDDGEPPKYVKRQYNHRQQMIVGSVVMFCVALALVGMNNYNPHR